MPGSWSAPGAGGVEGNVDDDAYRVGQRAHREVTLAIETDRPGVLALEVLDLLKLADVRRHWSERFLAGPGTRCHRCRASMFRPTRRASRRRRPRQVRRSASRGSGRSRTGPGSRAIPRFPRIRGRPVQSIHGRRFGCRRRRATDKRLGNPSLTELVSPRSGQPAADGWRPAAAAVDAEANETSAAAATRRVALINRHCAPRNRGPHQHNSMSVVDQICDGERQPAAKSPWTDTVTLIRSRL